MRSLHALRKSLGKFGSTSESVDRPRDPHDHSEFSNHIENMGYTPHRKVSKTASDGSKRTTTFYSGSGFYRHHLKVAHTSTVDQKGKKKIITTINGRPIGGKNHPFDQAERVRDRWTPLNY